MGAAPGSPFSLWFALIHIAILHSRRREWQAALERTETIQTLERKQGFTQWVAQAVSMGGRALVMLGHQEGMAQWRQRITARQNTGARNRARTLAGLATAYHRAGQAAEGLRVAIDGLAVAEETGEQNYTAELYCLKGEILLALPEDNHPEATGCFLQALAIARGQHAKSWELRAATSLARL